MQTYTNQELDRMVANGVPVMVVNRLRLQTVGYHPNHHQTCFCTVCRGGDGHIDDPCECAKCLKMDYTK